MNAYLEHVNLTVANIDETVRFLTTAFPEFKVRGQGVNNGQRWLHIGTQTSYLALGEKGLDASHATYRDSGLNHLGFVIEDAAAMRKRLESAGYKEGFKPTPHPHRIRIYYFDTDGMEWEFVQYLTDDAAKRNDYSE